MEFKDKNGKLIKDRDVISLIRNSSRGHCFIQLVSHNKIFEKPTFIIQDQYGDTIKESSLRYSIMTPEEFLESFLKYGESLTFDPKPIVAECYENGCVGCWGSYGQEKVELEIIGTIPDDDDMRKFME